MKRPISPIGKEMLAFQARLAEQHHYQPIPIDLFLGDIRDKYKANLPAWCCEANCNHPLYSSDGTQLCSGYTRIVIGDYGAFVEISPAQICKEAITCKKGQEFRYQEERFAKNVKYLWLTAKDTSDCKIYFQKKPVDYADYIPGMYYISPYELFLAENDEA